MRGPDAADAAGRTALHRAAAQGSVPAITACLTGLTPAQRRAALAQQDVWGDTPLHRAVAHGHPLPCVRHLLDLGAPCDLPGTLGRTPRRLAYTLGHTAVEAELAARGGTVALGPLDEAAWRSLLGELFGLTGTTQLGQVRLPLHHGIAEAAFPLLAAGLMAVVPQLACSADRVDALRIAHALHAAGMDINADPQDLLQRIRHGHLVILPAGTPAHAVTYVWAGGQALRCDRARHLSHPWGRRPCTVLSAAAQSLRPAALRQLQRAPFTPTAAAGWLAWRLSHGRTAHTAAALRAQVRHHPLRPQRANNCVTAGAKASIFAALCLLPGTRTPPQTAQLYKHITTLLRLHFVHAYRARPGARCHASLLHACAQKLAKRGHTVADLPPAVAGIVEYDELA